MTDPSRDKVRVSEFLQALESAGPDGAAAVLDRFCEPDARWRIFHPFGVIEGSEAAAASFWAPLARAFPDHEHRPGMIIAGEYEGERWVSTLGHLMGSFCETWLDIPPTHGLAYLRFGLNVRLRGERIDRAYVLLDVVDLMRQAGFYPLRRMPGSPEQWPMGPVTAGGPADAYDASLGAETLRIVREMQTGLGQGDRLKDLAEAARTNHSPHWHANMNWYGPAGIGSSRGKRGFLDYHGALFLQAFPDRAGIVREPEGEEGRPGHYVRAGDGRYAVTAGWPSLYGTHLGGGWLGMAPSGRKVEMRVADWYRTDAHDKIIDNWVMIDIPHILHQAGLDIFADLRPFVDPRLPRWPR